jgi:kinesin family protein 20
MQEAASFQVCRLTLVDLAGSERTKQAQTTGDRLKEAGNINKSLMVLGQCMEVLRANQRRAVVNSVIEVGKDGRIEARDLNKGLALVPFRHSKLTEALMDYFAGDGKIVCTANYAFRPCR